MFSNRLCRITKKRREERNPNSYLFRKCSLFRTVIIKYKTFGLKLQFESSKRTFLWYPMLEKRDLRLRVVCIFCTVAPTTCFFLDFHFIDKSRRALHSQGHIALLLLVFVVEPCALPEKGLAYHSLNSHSQEHFLEAS